MHLNFYLSKEDEKKEIIGIFQSDDPYGITLRAKQYQMPEDLAIRINSAKKNEWENELDLLLNNAYKENNKKLKDSLEFFESFWEENDGYYFNIIEKAIGEQVESYNVLLSHFVAGTSDWVGNDICTNAYSNKIPRKNAHVYYLLFEVILSHFFKKIRAKRKDLEDLQIWAMTELISFTILHNEFNEFESENMTDYVEVDTYINEAKELYKKCKNIHEFVEGIIKIYKK